MKLRFFNFFKKKQLVIDSNNVMPIFHKRAQEILRQLFSEELDKQGAIHQLEVLSDNLKDLIKANNPTGEELFKWRGVGLMIENSKNLARNY